MSGSADRPQASFVLQSFCLYLARAAAYLISVAVFTSIFFALVTLWYTAVTASHFGLPTTFLKNF